MHYKRDLAEARARMIRHQLRRRGISDERLLKAMAEVRRETFVAAELADLAYEDAPLSIAAGQTISQPYMVATMIEAAAVASSDRVLDIGTGSGYAAAVLGRLAAEVYSIERRSLLYEAARERLACGHGRIRVRLGDGHDGWPEAAPFDAILVAAATPCVPAALTRQLAVGGRLIVPIGEPSHQRLLKLVRKADGTWWQAAIAPVLFVPLVAGITA